MSIIVATYSFIIIILSYFCFVFNVNPLLQKNIWYLYYFQFYYLVLNFRPFYSFLKCFKSISIFIQLLNLCLQLFVWEPDLLRSKTYYHIYKITIHVYLNMKYKQYITQHLSENNIKKAFRSKIYTVQITNKAFENKQSIYVNRGINNDKLFENGCSKISK